MSAHDDEALLAVAERAARTAGALLLARFDADGHVGITTKSTVTDPVSEADLEAERAIREVLAQERPDDAVMGEEGEDSPGTSGLRWIVDPLDGTVNFLYGIPQWCVSVCCEGRVGVVHDPVRDECFATIAGRPSTLDGVPLVASRCEDLGLALVATGFGYDTAVREEQAAVVRRVIPRVRDIRRAGSAALDLAWCAAGRVDAFYERGVKEWDVAAGELLCAGAGLVVERLPAAGARPAGILAAPAGIVDELRGLATAGD